MSSATFYKWWSKFGGMDTSMMKRVTKLELNLRIKPKRRLKRDVPGALAVPRQKNIMWSIDFMHDLLR